MAGVEKSFADNVILWQKAGKWLKYKRFERVEKYVENVNNF